MEQRSFTEQVVAAIRAEIGYALLTVAGVVAGAVQALFTLPEAAEAILFIVASIATVFGGLGLGAAIGQERRDESLRLKLEPAYRRTISLYEGISLASWELGQGYGEVLEETKPSGLVDGRIVRRRTERVDVTLHQQTKTLDAALAEWRELLPERVDDTVKQLRSEGRLQ